MTQQPEGSISTAYVLHLHRNELHQLRRCERFKRTLRLTHTKLLLTDKLIKKKKTQVKSTEDLETLTQEVMFKKGLEKRLALLQRYYQMRLTKKPGEMAAPPNPEQQTADE